MLRNLVLYTSGMKSSLTDTQLQVVVEATGANFFKKRDAQGRPFGQGQFFMRLGITALQNTIHIPLSLASGKKPTGFVYQIEGTAAGALAGAEVSCTGAGITKVTLGTLLFAKIPKGSTANIRMVVDVKGELGKEYAVVVNRINYKLQPTDARYKKLDTAISTKVLKFK